MWERGFLGGIRAKLLQSGVIIGRRALHDVIVGCPMWKVPVGQLRLLPVPMNENVVSMLWIWLDLWGTTWSQDWHGFCMWQEAEDIIRSMNPIMLPDPLAVPEVGLGEDTVCCVLFTRFELYGMHKCHLINWLLWTSSVLAGYTRGYWPEK